MIMLEDYYCEVFLFCYDKQMRITIHSSGEDEHDDYNVTYIMLAENKNFKGTVEFYEFDNCFKEFAAEILKFPFESRQPITFDADGIKITILLANEVGSIRTSFTMRDEDNNLLKFSDTSIEVGDLHKLAKTLLNHTFSIKSSFTWESAS